MLGFFVHIDCVLTIHKSYEKTAYLIVTVR